MMVKKEVGDLITQAEAARLRGVSRTAIGKLIERGRLRSVAIAGRLLVYRSEVLAFERKPRESTKGTKKSAKKKGK
jgi:excisionase family DNA binding protein